MTLDGAALHDGRPLLVPPRSGYVLPLGRDVAAVRLIGGPCEVEPHIEVCALA